MRADPVEERLSKLEYDGRHFFFALRRWNLALYPQRCQTFPTIVVFALHGLPQYTAELPCFPLQNGQNGQSSPRGKSGPSSCGQPMLPWLIATCLTPCWRKKSFISCWIFVVVTSVATHRCRIASAPSWRITPTTIFVVVLSSGPYRATVAKGYFDGSRRLV